MSPNSKLFYKDLEAVLTASGAAFPLVSIGDLAGVVFRCLPLDGIAIAGGFCLLRLASCWW